MNVESRCLAAMYPGWHPWDEARHPFLCRIETSYQNVVAALFQKERLSKAKPSILIAFAGIA